MSYRMSITQANSLLASAAGACVDTRLLQAGDVFFALKGAKVDGHAFMLEAYKKGAVAAVVSKECHVGDLPLPLIVVADPLKELQSLAAKKIAAFKGQVVAVTGTVGKTTTKDFIAHLLSGSYRVAASPGNGNSQIGLPLAILNQLKDDSDVAVLEMGMTCSGEIASLVKIAPPDVAVLTAVGLAHAENFASLDEIAAAKAEIFSHPKTSLAIVARSICNYDALISSLPCAVHSFGCLESGAESVYNCQGHQLQIIQRGDLVASLPALPIAGAHNSLNFLAAALVARQLGLSWQTIAERAKTLTLPKRRLQRQEKEGICFIDDSYNASLESVKAALDSLPRTQMGGVKIAVLGEMLELGKFSEECHRKVALHALDKVDVMLCFGSECRTVEEVWKAAGREVFFAMERAAIVKKLRLLAKSGDVVLLKGANSLDVGQVLEEF